MTQDTDTQLTRNGFKASIFKDKQVDCKAKTTKFKGRVLNLTYLQHNTCILPIFLYGSECWAVTKNDVRKTDALDQWCLRMLIGINWHQHVCNEEVRRLTKQPHLSAIVQ